MKQVEIPDSLFKAVEEKMQTAGFSSVSEFVAYAVRKFLSELADKENPFPEEEKEAIKQRLKALGYI
jgi:Arc/MetJ-type ribon-helix-helix transcriptional regulator